MEPQSVDKPDNEWIKHIGKYAMKMSELRNHINKGKLSYVLEYKQVMYQCYIDIRGFAGKKKEELRALSKEVNNVRGLAQRYNTMYGVNSLTIINDEEWLKYYDILDKFDEELREVMITNNFLVKTMEKRMRLS